MRMMLIGDIVGSPGRTICSRVVPMLRKREKLDLVVANAENAAGGSGLTPEIYNNLRQAEIDVLTMGDHVYRRREILPLLAGEPIVRPGNYPPEAPGRAWVVATTAAGHRVLVCCLLGRTFMPPVDCPFRAVDRLLDEACRASGENDPSIPAWDGRFALVDFHAEATSDKQLMGRHLDGRVSAVLGTHTHVATADEQIFPGGTAFQCDVGMTGPHLSILGRRIDRVRQAALTFTPTPFEVASDDVRLHGTVVEADDHSGRALGIWRVAVDLDGAVTTSG